VILFVRYASKLIRATTALWVRLLTSVSASIARDSEGVPNDQMYSRPYSIVTL
jgi:hypothetical protein